MTSKSWRGRKSSRRSGPCGSIMLRAAWPKIIKLAKSLKLGGCRIRVKEQGETIILIGAAAALRYSELDFSAA